MKILKKINKGLILTIIVVVILGVYLVALEAKRNKAKPEIDEAINEYIAITNKYAIYPEDLQKSALTKIDYVDGYIEKRTEEYINQFAEEAKSNIIDNENAIKIQKEYIQNFLENCNNLPQAIVSKFERKITKIESYDFDDDQVTVKLKTSIDSEYRYLENSEEKISKNSTKNNDTITLQNVDGKWKVVYADLTFPSVSDTTTFSIY